MTFFDNSANMLSNELFSTRNSDIRHLHRALSSTNRSITSCASA